MKNRLSKFAGAVASLAMIVGFSSSAFAGVLFGLSGNTIRGTNSDVMYIQLGSGYNVTNVRYIYLTVNDTAQATYIGNPVLMECNTAVLASCGIKEYTGMTALGSANYVTVAQTGAGKRLITFDMRFYCLYTGGACTVVDGLTSPITMSPTKFYYIRYISTNSINSSVATGYTALYGTSATIHTSDGTPIQCMYGTGSTQICTPIGSPYHYVADSLLTNLDIGFVTPASDSSGASLSGARAYCNGQFTSDFAASICTMFGYLFIPTQNSVSQFFDSATELKGHIPYSYVVQLQALYGSISSSSGTFPSITVPLNIGLGQAHSSISLFSLSAIQTYLPSPLLATLRTLMSASLWLVFALFVWRTGVNEFRR